MQNEVLALVIPADINQKYYYTAVTTLEDYQRIVEGSIEAVQLRKFPSTTMFINEEGKHLCLPKNARATEIVSDTISEWDAIVGDVLLVDIDFDTGESIDVGKSAATYCEHCCIRSRVTV